MRRDHQEQYLQSSSNHRKIGTTDTGNRQRISPDGVDWRLIFVSRRGLHRVLMANEKWVAEAVSFTLVRYH